MKTATVERRQYQMAKLIIKSCAHCGAKAKVVLEGMGSGKFYAGWECEGCREVVAGVSTDAKYMIKKMGQQWNMRAEVNDENQTTFSWD